MIWKTPDLWSERCTDQHKTQISNLQHFANFLNIIAFEVTVNRCIEKTSRSVKNYFQISLLILNKFKRIRFKSN